MPVPPASASPSTVSTEDAALVAAKRAIIARTFPEFADFENQPSFAGTSVKVVEDDGEYWFAYIVHGSGLPIAQATCFRADLGTAYTVGEFPDLLDSYAGYRDVDRAPAEASSKPRRPRPGRAAGLSAADASTLSTGVRRLRPAVEGLRAEFGPYPLARARPFLEVEGRELVRLVQDEVGLGRELRLVVVRNGQLVLTDALAEDCRAGVTREEIAEMYSLTPEQVDQVLRFELIAGRDAVA